ncbi:MAG: ABC transporter ATP-binding protein, partial [Planctomycetales bacterium]|nr:ABC transporter ATP-binding protein [Planctomycetales bacterium]
MIDVHALHKSYGKTAAVGGISFAVGRGETFGLLGPNGAGKSTTIQLILGLSSPDSGSVRVDGDLRPTDPAARMTMGAAPQSLALYEELSAEENLTFFARLYGLAGTQLRKRVTWALDFAGLTDRSRARVKTYSGGMKRRLNLAVALVHEPQILLLDEPTVGVDPQSRNHLFDRIEEVKAQGCTIIYTTHYM